jgi:putative ABC transport system ATP-binding protein
LTAPRNRALARQEHRMGLLIHKLKKTYVAPDGSSVPVIDVPELYIADGEQVALIGTSGSGKTTLLHMIAGILAPDSGNVVFGYDPARPDSDDAIDITSLTEAQRDVFRGQSIGYIFQTHHLLPGFTALENVLLGMSFTDRARDSNLSDSLLLRTAFSRFLAFMRFGEFLFSTGRGYDPQWARHLLEEVGLADRLNYKPAKLSVGQQQRVAVARALANRPKLVLADEPTGALDATNAQQVLDLIRRLCSEVASSLLLVSHDLDIARQLPRVLTLSEINIANRPLAGANS